MQYSHNKSFFCLRSYLTLILKDLNSATIQMVPIDPEKTGENNVNERTVVRSVLHFQI